MAKLERNFIGGKMNIDLDDRLVQPGTYRRGQNISVSTSDNADVGALESVRGNLQITPPPNLSLNNNLFILGNTIDRLNDKVYWYFVGNRTEGIYELDVSLDEDGNPKDAISRILEFSVGRKVLNFNVDNLITGSAVIGDLLIWTDGLNPVRKLNINRLRDSGNFYIPSIDKVYNENTMEDEPFYTIYPVTETGTEYFNYFNTGRDVDLEFQVANQGNLLAVTGVRMGGGENEGSDEALFTYNATTRVVTLQNRPEMNETTITVNFVYTIIRASEKSTSTEPTALLFSDINPAYDGNGKELVNLLNTEYNEEDIPIGEEGFSSNAPLQQLAFPGDLINLGKRPPLQPPKVVKYEPTAEEVTKPIHNNNLEENFIYFAYRYIYADGEVTPLSPFSEPAFLPGPFNINREQGTLSSFINTYQELDIYYNTGSEEVTDVEIWLTRGVGRPIQSLVSINKANENISSSTPYEPVEEKFRYSNDKTYRTLPTDQANYIFSDIPITAKALEFVGNRLVLGNYTRNYSLTKINEQGSEITPDFHLELDEINSKKQDPESRVASSSIKSDRDYEVGVVYLDQEGRQSSVIVSEDNTYALNWDRHQYSNAFQLRIKSAAPYWATHYRIFYKAVGGRYENIYPIKVIQNNQGDRLYLQLSPADVNKIDADTRLTFKGNSKGVYDTRKEFRVDPYSANVGTEGGFRLEENENGVLTLDSSTSALSFFVPFDVVTEHTTGLATTNNLVNQPFDLPIDRTMRVETVITVDDLSKETIIKYNY